MGGRIGGGEDDKSVRDRREGEEEEEHYVAGATKTLFAVNASYAMKKWG